MLYLPSAPPYKGGELKNDHLSDLTHSISGGTQVTQGEAILFALLTCVPKYTI
jgi:hypothetical protein